MTLYDQWADYFLDLIRKKDQKLSRRLDARSCAPCIVYTGARRGHGYGHIGRRGETLSAHRYVWTLLNGQPKKGVCVLHVCDNPPCVNIQHLYLGTQADNGRDKAVRGRAAKKLTKVKAVEIRKQYDNGENLGAIAKKFNVSKANVCMIGKRIIWARA